MHKYKTMLPFCLKFKYKNKKKTENINPRVSKTSNNKTILLPIYATKKSKFIKKQKTRGY